jgi:hypothetical protein
MALGTLRDVWENSPMAKKRVYIAFDFDDIDVKNELIRQSKLSECPFDLEDCSIQKPIDRAWPTEAERRINDCDCVVLLCGKQTHQAGGASTELQIATKLQKPRVFLAVTRVETPTPPNHTPKGTPIYTWTWATVSTLIEGGTPPSSAVVRLAP